MTCRRPPPIALSLLAALALAGCAGLFSEKRSETFEARKRLARELIARQDYASAFFYADELHREAPRDADVLTLRGVIYRERGLPAEAEADLLEALRVFERHAEAHAALALLYDTSGQGDKADKHHLRATALAPENPIYLNNHGFSLYLRREHREAIEVYKRAARLAPTSRRVRTNLGFAYAAAGDLPRAAREFQMGGSPAEAKNNLGFVYEQRGDLDRAYDLYVEALRLNPKSEKTRANLSHVAGRLGRELPSDLPGAAGGPSPGVDPDEQKNTETP